MSTIITLLVNPRLDNCQEKPGDRGVSALVYGSTCLLAYSARFHNSSMIACYSNIVSENTAMAVEVRAVVAQVVVPAEVAGVRSYNHISTKVSF